MKSELNKNMKNVYPISLIKTIIIFLVVVFIGAFGTAYFYLNYETDLMINVLREKITLSKGESVKNAINYYVDIPRQANAIIAHSIQESDLRSSLLASVRSELHSVMDNIFSDGSYLSTVAFGSKYGDYIGLSRKTNKYKQEYLILKSPDTNNKLTFYFGSSEASGIEDAIDNYDVSARPWYAEVSRTRKPSWTQAYRDMNSTKTITISYSSPVYNKKEEFVGVVSSDLRLTELNATLRSLQPFPGSILLVLNDKNQIVASSQEDLTQGQLQGRIVDLSGLTLSTVFNSSSSLVRDSAIALNTPGTERLITSNKGVRNFALVVPVGEGSLLPHWKTMIIFPENTIMQEVNYYRHLALLICMAFFIIGLTVIIIVISKMVLPLKLITERADNLVNYSWIPLNKKWQFSEIARLDNAFYKFSGKVSSSIQALEKQIYEDIPSGLMSRAGLIKKITQTPIIKRNLLIMVHAISMETVSSLLGKEHEQDYLSDFVRHIKLTLPDDVLIAREMLDKFIIIFPSTVSDDECLWYRDKLSSYFHESPAHAHYEGNNYIFNGYGGMVRQDITPSSIVKIIMNASVALNYSKRQDSNSYFQLYEKSMRESELYNINLYSDLRCALNGNEFYLVLQPIVNIETGDCIEAECLIRWESPKQGFIPPDKFIPLAEKTGFILPLGKWIIEKACEELKILISRGVSESFKLHINISALQLVQPDFSIHLLDTVRKNGLRNENICIELTETVLLSEVKHTCEILNALRNYGISVAIDDFGSGFSSLSYLHMLPFDSIKIDRSFISSVLKDDNSEAVISAVVVLARGFNVPLVAEGIEDNAVRVRLIELGVEKAQGYYFCRPSRFEFFKCNDGKLDYSVETATLK